MESLGLAEYVATLIILLMQKEQHWKIGSIMALFTILFYCVNAHAQTSIHEYKNHQWKNLGSVGFSSGKADYTDLALDPSGTPYVIYVDGSLNQKATVMKFNGSSWIIVGDSGFSAGQAENTNIVIDASGTPYVTFQDHANGHKASVMKFNGTSWVSVGIPGFSPGPANYPKIALDAAGMPYIAYEDSINGYKATVMKFNGTSWVNVGNAGFSAGSVFYIDITINSAGTPYVAYIDDAFGNEAVVKKFDGNAWVNVGNPGFSLDVTVNTKITFDPSGTPYVVFGTYYVENIPGRATVMKYNDTNWVYVGQPPLSESAANYTDIVIDDAGIPYIVYEDYANDYKATVMRFDTSWENVGTANFSPGGAETTNISIDAKGTIYVVYSDATNAYKASVMTIAPDSVIHLGTNELLQNAPNKMVISPVPTNDILNVQLNNTSTGKATISIHDLTGKEILSNNFILERTNETVSFSLNGIAVGAYFVKATINGQPLPAQKLIKN